ncbi:MAG TPA: pyridoxamine 5'-phosphate oxidase [Burkholderiales bacterium]|nr:pyridoxamine 5'-phosphate oxidase [Burkholderiales bacterium]
MDIAALRKEYTRESLDLSHIRPDPLAQFDYWLQEAIRAELPEPTAMTLATVDANGQPSARVVLLKGVDHGGFVFYTNYESRKGEELATQPRAALLFFWTELERQVRIEGTVEQVGADESDEYYQRRPLASRIGAWASPQSRVITDRTDLEARVQAISAQYGQTPPRPAHWGGYRLRPHSLEFWQGRPSRLHDRLRYLLNEHGSWQIDRLAP